MNKNNTQTISYHIVPEVLVVGDDTDGLLAHGALVCVARRLIVVWVWNDAGTHTKDGKRLNLKMRRVLQGRVGKVICMYFVQY